MYLLCLMTENPINKEKIVSTIPLTCDILFISCTFLKLDNQANFIFIYGSVSLVGFSCKGRSREGTELWMRNSC